MSSGVLLDSKPSGQLLSNPAAPADRSGASDQPLHRIQPSPTICERSGRVVGRGRLAQLVRAPLSHSGGHWFESSIAHQAAAKCAEVAEWQTRYIQGVVSFTGVGVQISPSASPELSP